MRADATVVISLITEFLTDNGHTIARPELPNLEKGVPIDEAEACRDTGCRGQRAVRT